MKSLVFILFLVVSCANKEDEDLFAYDLVGSRFLTQKYKEIAPGSNWFSVTGTKYYIFTDDSLKVSYSTYKESGSVSCDGTIIYNFSLEDKDTFDSELESNSTASTEDFEDSVYSIFSPHDIIEDEELEEEDEEVKIINYYIIANVVSNNINSTCPILNPGELFLFVKLYKNGDLSIYDFNRQINFVTKGRD